MAPAMGLLRAEAPVPVMGLPREEALVPVMGLPRVEAPVPVMGHLREEAPDPAMALLREGATDLVMGLPREGVMVPVTEVRPAAGTAQGTVVVTDLVMAGPGAAMVRTTGTTAPPGAVDQTP